MIEDWTNDGPWHWTFLFILVIATKCPTLEAWIPLGQSVRPPTWLVCSEHVADYHVCFFLNT